MTTRIIKLWIGGEQRPENWYYTKTVTKEAFISELCRFIAEGAQSFYISIDLEHEFLLDVIKEDGIQEVMPILIHVHSAQYNKLEEIKEKIKEIGCMYGKLILL